MLLRKSEDHIRILRYWDIMLMFNKYPNIPISPSDLKALNFFIWIFLDGDSSSETPFRRARLAPHLAIQCVD